MKLPSEKGCSQALASARSLSHAFLLACATITLITITPPSTIQNQAALTHLDELHAQVDRVRTHAANHEAGARLERERLDEAEQQILGQALVGLESPQKETALRIARLTCASGPCSFSCHWRRTPPIDGTLAAWLNYLTNDADTVYDIQGARATEPITDANLLSIGEIDDASKASPARLDVLLEECSFPATENGSDSVTIPIQVVGEDAVNTKLLLEFQAERRPAIDRAAEERLSIQAIQTLRGLETHGCAEKTPQQCTEWVTQQLDESKQALEIAGVRVENSLINRFAGVFLLLLAIYLGTHLSRLRVHASESFATVLADAAWFPLFPRGFHLWAFIGILLFAPVLATRPDFIAVLVGDSSFLPAPDLQTAISGLLAGLIASGSALWGLYPLRKV